MSSYTEALVILVKEVAQFSSESFVNGGVSDSKQNDERVVSNPFFGGEQAQLSHLKKQLSNSVTIKPCLDWAVTHTGRLLDRLLRSRYDVVVLLLSFFDCVSL